MSVRRRGTGHRKAMGFLLPTELTLPTRSREVVERRQVRSHTALARALHGGDAHRSRRSSLLIREPLIGLEQDADPGQFPGTALAPLQQLLQWVPSLGGALHNLFLLRHRAAPSCVEVGADRTAKSLPPQNHPDGGLASEDIFEIAP